MRVEELGTSPGALHLALSPKDQTRHAFLFQSHWVRNTAHINTGLQLTTQSGGFLTI